jgi:folate-binding protein YgfZ
MTHAYEPNGVAELTHLGVIRAIGPQAGQFLHNQLTQDFLLLKDHQARLAGFCSAKGRLQASFIAWRQSPEEFLLVCSRDLLPSTLKRLSMFVLRTAVKLSDVSSEYKIYGTLGTSAEVWGASKAPWSLARSNNAVAVSLYPAAGHTRALWVAPHQVPAPEGPTLDLGLWHWTDVQSGVAQLALAHVDAYVPQMLNYESVDGVNFKKGCYPGQEVVARSQFRGVIKRRTYLGHCTASAQVGDELFLSTDPEQSCATVVACAAHPNGGFDLLFCAQTQAVAEGPLALGQPQGPLIALRTLPYPLRDDI